MTDSEFADAVEKIAAQTADVLATMPERDRHRYVRQVMKRSKLVFAIWHTDEDRYVWCVKGLNTPEGTMVRAAAFFVRSEADAIGMRRDWGDGAISTHH